MLTYNIELTSCWPCCWYGGPYWNGQRMTNATGNFFRTEEEAIAYVLKYLSTTSNEKSR